MENETPKDKGIPIPFVVYSNKKFIITDEAKELLSDPQFKSIGIISLVGKYRTGKSFLLNRVLLNEKHESGFGVGPTIKPCTKGIWMWSKPIEVENNHFKEKFHTFFIDTEGLGAYDEEINHDSKIFLVAVLISSLFILNSFGNIDENSINSLSFILNISRTIKLNQNNYDASTNPDELSAYFPSLLWLLRDFSLKLEDSQGNTITAKQYLENALQLQKGFSDAVEEKNKVRKLITSYFKERDCFSMVRPVENEKDLQNLQTLEDTEIRKEFLEQAQMLRNKVFKKVKPKIFNNKILSGSMLIELLENILDSINKGAVPVIENSWKYMLYNESLKGMNSVFDKLKKKIQDFKELNKDNQKFLKDFDRFQQETSKQLVDEFLKEAISPESAETQECLVKIKSKISEEFKKFYEENSKVFENQLNELFEQNTKAIYEAFDTDKYYKNHYVFFRDLENLKESAENTVPDFSNKKDLLYEKIIIIIKKFIELVFLKNKNLNEQEISMLRGENSILLNKYNFKSEEYDKNKLEYTNNVNRLNNQVLDLKIKEKTLEEKLNQILTEKKNATSSNEENLNAIKNEFNAKIDKLNAELSNYRTELKNKDDQLLMMKFSEEKLSALNNQKIEFLEKENLSYKDRYDLIRNENENLKESVEDLNAKLDAQNAEIMRLKAIENELNMNRNSYKNNFNVNNKKQSIEKFNSGPITAPTNNLLNNYEYDNNLNNNYNDDFLLIQDNNNNNNPNLVYMSPIMAANRKYDPAALNNNNFNFNNNNQNNSTNNSMFGFNLNSEFQVQQQKILEVLKEIKSDQINENRKLMNEFKQEIFAEMNKLINDKKEILEDNRIFKANISSLEQRNKELEDKLAKMKDIKQTIKQASAIKCLFCNHIYEKDFFISQHYLTCRTFPTESKNYKETKAEKQEESMISNTKNATNSDINILTTGNYINKETNFNQSLYNNHTGLTMKILEVEILRDEFNNDFKDYLTEININNKKIYNINKRFTDFVNLNIALKAEFSREPNVFPDTEIILSDEYDFESNITAENIHALENYFNELSLNLKIYYSVKFRKFFKIPDEEDSPYQSQKNYLSNPSSNNALNANKLNIINNNVINNLNSKPVARHSRHNDHISPNLKIDISNDEDGLIDEDSLRNNSIGINNRYNTKETDMLGNPEIRETEESSRMNTNNRNKNLSNEIAIDPSKLSNKLKGVINQNTNNQKEKYSSLNMNKNTQKVPVGGTKLMNNKTTIPSVSPIVISNNNPNEFINRNSAGMQKLFSKIKNPNNSTHK